ncbi:DUF6296 family protein [Kitasatospora sp. CM 4170]|uniref:DUF6296 family protein n=1 Tax=Kitasatospora aburaviensis TaxID=67265 RepID=A0ABW1EYQ5_9ACTN|nr:DUF6296 family protein [Kitasatospora sp. CM 4170]WNM43551.1 DUF6296 family protein [Kitasatospora sp. CM 4170]
MKRAKHYRLVVDDPYGEVVLTASGAMGNDGTEVYVDDTGEVRVDIDHDGIVRAMTTTLPLGHPLRAEPLD